jgi:broad specificity phosphatase PhoE
MSLIRLFTAAALLALAACASVAPQPAEPSFYVMRHLEKAAGPDPGLSEQGRANAARLAEWFRSDPPASIYVSTTRRARETAEPLAARLGVTPKSYDPADTPALAARVLSETGTVLVVGHSNTVPDIVERLGGTRPPDISEDSFGDIWHIHGTPRKTDKKSLGGG